jgi:hypothetical protein
VVFAHILERLARLIKLSDYSLEVLFRFTSRKAVN